MTKIRKLKKKKQYHYNINRKRLNKKRPIVTDSSTVKNSWNMQTLSQKHFKEIGLVYDVNQDIKYLNRQGDIHRKSFHVNQRDTISTLNDPVRTTESSIRGNHFKFSKDQRDYLIYLLKKYGDDYKAMSKDKKNYLQHTWKQIRYKINLLKSIPDHYNEFLINKKVSEK